LIQIALFEKNLVSASGGALQLFLDYGFEIVVRDSLIWNFVLLSAVIVGLFTGIVAAFVAWLVGSDYFFLVFLLSALLAISNFVILGDIFYGTGNSIFISACLSDDAKKLQALFPDLCVSLKQYYPQTYIIE
jgi:hypothetical protein